MQQKAVVMKKTLIGQTLPLVFGLCLGLASQAAHAAEPWSVVVKVIHVEDVDTLALPQSYYSRVSIRLFTP